MDGDGVTDSPSSGDQSKGSEGDGLKKPSPNYTEIFNQVFPYYLSIGMSSDEFWRQDVCLVKAYREADKLRLDRLNTELWLQGMYFYEAVCDASPIFNPYAKRNTKPRPYPSEPYSLHPPSVKEQKTEEQKNMEKLRAKMDSFASKVNAKMKGKEVREGG